MELDRVADAVGYEGILARNVDLDETAAELPRDPCAQRLVQGVLFVAETAADVRLDDADVAPRLADRLADGTAYDVRDLRGGDDRHPVSLRIGVADKVFDVTVLHRLGGVPLVDTDETGLLFGLLIIAGTGRGVIQEIPGEILLDLRRTFLQRLERVENEGQLFVFDFDEPGSLRGRDLVLRDDGAHVVTVIADVLVQQLSVRGILVGRIGRPRMACGRETDIGDVKGREDPDDSRNFFRLVDIDLAYETVRDSRADDPDDQRIFAAEVVRILCAPGHLVECIDSRDALSNVCHVRCPLSFLGDFAL